MLLVGLMRRLFGSLSISLLLVGAGLAAGSCGGEVNGENSSAIGGDASADGPSGSDPGCEDGATESCTCTSSRSGTRRCVGGVWQVCICEGPVCGNGIVESGELCDSSDFNGETCATATMYALQFGTLRCSGCMLDTSGCRSSGVGGTAGSGASGGFGATGGMGATTGFGAMSGIGGSPTTGGTGGTPDAGTGARRGQQ